MIFKVSHNKEKYCFRKNATAGHFSVMSGDPQHLEFDKTINSIVSVRIMLESVKVTIHRSLCSGGTTIIDLIVLDGNSRWS